MKTQTAGTVLAILCAFVAIARSQTQTVTLAVSTNVNPSASFGVATNQIITVLASDYANNQPTVVLSFHNGVKSSQLSGSISVGAVFTGVTNVFFNGTNTGWGLLTFTVATPPSQSTATLPANAVVIPTDAVGPVQIVLESSSDLVNWTSSLPGTYGNTYSNRFFRVRAIAQ